MAKYYILSPASKAKGISKNRNKNKSKNIAANKAKIIQRTTVKVNVPGHEKNIEKHNYY
ncbi:hypothetical protein HMSSN036_43820 [Paenibacillus macerans]|uniref:hypothetical protein n=1 Tax=Paenibacillus TaxID=44249 RepID=UPI001F0DE610|nr:hypothetical protein [Paenibacillus macerans]MDU7472361.1 hypothetical protein [Paenibacillus macerans]MEC0138807.1 hypothetical protein [Paenibacillus macerans]UMV48676.1 hypothetical protein LMZ02_04595 [Paenibacillus macerans]GJM72166.1 hypothetical protein HMSSN036_43820 [Paenibacillus macerans]